MKKITHYIFISSSYSKGTRIAYDVPKLESTSSDIVSSINKEIRTKCGEDVRLGFQCIHVESEKWEDVVNADGFFRDMLVVPTLEEFICLINKDRDLTAKDVAKYIICKLRCSHLRMQEFLYFCYADYLCKTGKKLFEDEIIASSYGPIVSSVYDVYKEKYGDLNDSAQRMPFGKKFQLAMRSKILFTNDGINKAFSIDKTIENYKHCSAIDLVSIIRREGTPWSHTVPGRTIFDECIKNYHIYERCKLCCL